MADARRKAVLLAAGLGTRLRPLTLVTPKCLIEIRGRPLLDFWFDSLERCGVDEVLVNTHHLRDQVQDVLARARETRPYSIVESYEPELLGSAGTISDNASFMDDGDVCVIAYVDNLSNVDLDVMVDFHLAHADPLTMLLFHTTRPRECGIATLDADGHIIDFVEKPDEPASDLANAGVYVVDADTYREIAALRSFDFGYDVLPHFVGRMRGLPFAGYHLDIGNLDALERARSDAERVFGDSA